MPRKLKPYEGEGSTAVIEPEDMEGTETPAGSTADIVDVKTGEVLEGEDCKERLRLILLKRAEIAKAQDLVDECRGQVDAAEEALDAAKKELAARRGE